jgi:hypothetical protein
VVEEGEVVGELRRGSRSRGGEGLVEDGYGWSVMLDGRGGRVRECLQRALKLVSVAFVGLALPLPTFSLGFWKSFFFSFLAFADLPMVAGDTTVQRDNCGQRWTY